MPITMPELKAGGDINPSRFVKLSTAFDFTVLQATDGTSSGGDRVFGVATDAAKSAPLPSASGLAAADGDPIRIHGVGEHCKVMLGASVTRGDMLKADANGKAISTISGAGHTEIQWVGAEALESGSSGELIECVVRIFTLRTNLS